MATSTFNSYVIHTNLTYNNKIKLTEFVQNLIMQLINLANSQSINELIFSKTIKLHQIIKIPNAP